MQDNEKGLIVAIIPAKGSSKGVPGKNIKLLDGKPLIAYSIEAAKNSGVVDKVFVSTDSEEVAKISKHYGAEIVWETPDKAYSYDLATESYLRFAVDEIEKQGINIRLIILMQPTSPFTNAGIVREAVKKIEEEGFESAFSAFRKIRKRRQEMTPWYCETGAVFAIKNNLFKKIKNRYGGKIGIIIVPEEDGLEIDEPSNWWLAEQIIKRRKMKPKIKKRTFFIRLILILMVFIILGVIFSYI